MSEKPICRRTTRTNITFKFGVSQLAVLLWGSRLHGLVSHRFFARISARIFCTDVLHGCFARIFARIFCTDVLRGFFARFLARSFCADFCADCLQELLYRCLHGFFWVSQNTCLEAPNFTERISWKIHHALGAFWGGARRGRRVR